MLFIIISMVSKPNSLFIRLSMYFRSFEGVYPSIYLMFPSIVGSSYTVFLAIVAAAGELLVQIVDYAIYNAYELLHLENI